MKKYLLTAFLILGLGVSTAYAADLKNITDTLMTPTALVTKLLIFGCYVVGAILIFAAMAQYKIHRQSPKLVPLTTPILLLLIGVALLFIPYFTSLPSKTGNVVEQSKRAGTDQGPRSRLVDEQAEQEESYGPGNLPEDEPVEPYEPPSQSGGGHWSDKYR